MTHGDLFRDLVDAIGLIVVMILLAVLMWLFLIATPPQNSAECDALEVEFENAMKCGRTLK